MKQKWSNKWTGSKQSRKQRKYKENAPLHIRRKFMSANLSPPLRKRYKKRSLPVRKGDEVRVMTGSLKGKKGKVERVDLKKGKVYIESVKMKKPDGSEIHKPVRPSNLQITDPDLDDKMRLKKLERKKEKTKKEKAK